MRVILAAALLLVCSCATKESVRKTYVLAERLDARLNTIERLLEMRNISQTGQPTIVEPPIVEEEDDPETGTCIVEVRVEEMPDFAVKYFFDTGMGGNPVSLELVQVAGDIVSPMNQADDVTPAEIGSGTTPSITITKLNGNSTEAPVVTIDVQGGKVVWSEQLTANVVDHTRLEVTVRRKTVGIKKYVEVYAFKDGEGVMFRLRKP